MTTYEAPFNIHSSERKSRQIFPKKYNFVSYVVLLLLLVSFVNKEFVVRYYWILVQVVVGTKLSLYYTVDTEEGTIKSVIIDDAVLYSIFNNYEAPAFVEIPFFLP